MEKALIMAILGSVVRLADGFCGNPPMRDTGFWASVLTSFTETEQLGIPPQNMRYAFIIARHGMVVPVVKSYRKDRHFKTKWEKDHFTTHGRRLMKKLGRSLATRYNAYIKSINGVPANVYVSSMNTEYGYSNALEILNGLYDGMPEPPVDRRADIDKFQLLKSPDACKAYEKLKADLDQSRTNAEATKYFETLKKRTGETAERSVWYTNSWDRVYRLWEVLDFERKSKKWSPHWYREEVRTQMRNYVNKYVSDAGCGTDSVSMFAVGPLFKQVIDEYYNQSPKLHIHVTNDFTFTAFKKVLTGWDMKVPEFGETLMVEVDEHSALRIHSYKPYRINQFERGLPIIEEESYTMATTMDSIRARLTAKGMLIDGNQWIERCTGTRANTPPSPPPPAWGQRATQPAAAQPPPKTKFPTAEELDRLMPRGNERVVSLMDKRRTDGSTEVRRTHWQPMTSPHDEYQTPRKDEAYRQTTVRQTPYGPVVESTGVSVTY